MVASALSVYSRAASVVSADELSARMAARGRPISFHFVLGSEKATPDRWTVANITPQGRDAPLISLSVESLDPDTLEEIAADYADGLTAERRDLLLQTKTKVRLTTAEWSSPEVGGFLVDLTDLLATGEGALIHEIEPNVWRLAAEHRAHHANLLGRSA